MDFIVTKLYTTYSLKPQNIEQSQKIYSSLFSMVTQDVIEIFTTNYDNIIEEYCREVQYDLIDGFEYDNISRFTKWKPLVFAEKIKQNRKCIFLYKLHGSLNWKRHKRYDIIKLEGVEKIMKNDWQYSDDLLVKPTLSPKEEEGEEPFRTLISKFDEKLRENDVCIIIGYSFRDRRINEILHKFLTERKKLVIVSPSASRNFDKNFVPLNSANHKNNCIFIGEIIEWSKKV